MMNSCLKARRACNPSDLAKLRLPVSPVLSIDGGYFVIIEKVSKDRLNYTRCLWHISRDGEENQLTSVEDGLCSLPSLSPSGDFLSYVASVQGRSRVGILRLESFEIHTVFEMSGAISALSWVDDSQLAVAVDSLNEDELVGQDEGAAVQIEWLNYKKDGRFGFAQPTSNLWLVDVQGEKEFLRSLHQRITSLEAAKRTLFFVLEPCYSDVVTPEYELWTLDVDTDSLTKIWKAASHIEAIAVTHASQHIMAIASEADGINPPVPRLWHVDLKSGPQIVYEDLDLACENSVQGDTRPSGNQALLRSVPGGDDVLFIATEDGDSALFVGSVSNTRPRRVTANGWSVCDFSEPQNYQVAVTLESSVSPVEVFKISCGLNDSNAMFPISGFNRGFVSQLDIAAPEIINIVAQDGQFLSGYLYRRASEKKTPLLLRIHGGPHLCFGSGFDLEAQIAVGRGMSVLLPNLRGSSGRGTEFRSLSVREWGGMDYEDLVAFVDHLESDSSIDTRREFIQGGSYGGYLTNWALTKTKRFRAAISERSVSNLISKFGTSDNGFNTNKLEMGGADLFDESLGFLIDRSPLFSAPDISTPLLLIHGEMDYRCPIEQSEQLFVALRRLGKAVKFVRFPGESHQLSYFGRPDHRIERLSLIFAWWERYL